MNILESYNTEDRFWLSLWLLFFCAAIMFITIASKGCDADTVSRTQRCRAIMESNLSAEKKAEIASDRQGVCGR